MEAPAEAAGRYPYGISAPSSGASLGTPTVRDDLTALLGLAEELRSPEGQPIRGA